MSYAAGEEDERVGASCETAEVDVLKLEEYHEHDEEEMEEEMDDTTSGSGTAATMISVVLGMSAVAMFGF